MKKFIVLTIALVLMSTSAFAVLSGSGHDFTFTTDICGPCHVPHNGDNATAPLWSHSSTTATFAMYNGTSGFMPAGVSNACLSCHDGVTNMSAYVGGTGTNIMSATAAGYLGTDLTDDHPVNVTLPVNAGYKLASTVVTEAVAKLEGGTMVECSSCHDVHNGGETTSGNMLRVANTGSAICLACHVK